MIWSYEVRCTTEVVTAFEVLEIPGGSEIRVVQLDVNEFLSCASCYVTPLYATPIIVQGI